MKFDFSKEPGLNLDEKYKVGATKPLVSIITAYYNAGEYFEQTFNCIMNQTFPYYEWLIVNDGSTVEKDLEVLEVFAKKDERIQVIHKENGGATSARNVGINKSKSEIIIFLDADDLIDKRFVEIIYMALYYHPGAAWAYTDSVGFGATEYVWEREFSSKVMKTENILPYIAGIRKEVFDEGLYDDNAKNMWEDWQFWLKLLKRGYRPIHIKLKLFWYRRLTTGALSSISKDKNLTHKLKSIIKELGRDVPDSINEIPINNSCNQFVAVENSNWNFKLEFNKNKINILLFIPHMVVGGADKFNIDFLKNIDRDRFNIGIITTLRSENKLRQTFYELVDDVFELPTFVPTNKWSNFVDYYIKSRDIKIIINISSFYAYYLLPWIKHEYPQIKIIDYIHADSAYWRNGGYARLSSQFDTVLDRTIVANKVTHDIMVNSYKKNLNKCIVSYIGTDTELFNPNLYDGNKIRNKYKIGENVPVVLYLCRISQEKRPLLMVDIAYELIKLIPDVCFLIVGDGDKFTETLDKVKHYNIEDNFVFAGNQMNVEDYYAASDVLLISSIKEGLTLTTFEAMSMGLPVVSADVGGQKEIVNDNTGKLIPCLQNEITEFENKNFCKEEINNYVNSLYDILVSKEKKESIGKFNRDLIVDKYQFKYTVETIQNEILDLLDNKERCNDKECIAKLLKEMIVLINAYTDKELQVDEIWEARNWFKDLYEIESTKTTKSYISCGENEEQDKCLNDLRLSEIYSMRSWKLVEKYMHFMNHNRIGRVVYKITRCFIKE